MSHLPVVVFIAPDGTHRYPGRHDVKVPKGFVKKEMNFYEARRYCKEVNDGQRAELARHLENVQRAEETIQRRSREELLRGLRNMSPLAREFAEYAIEQGNKRDAEKYRSWDPGFHIEGLE